MARPTQQEIDEFNQRMAEPEGEDEEDFEIELYTPEGHGARLPYRKGRQYLQKHFGIDADDLPGGPNSGNPPTNSQPAGKRGKSNPQDQQLPEGQEGQIPPEGGEQVRPSQRYFGRH